MIIYNVLYIIGLSTPFVSNFSSSPSSSADAKGKRLRGVGGHISGAKRSFSGGGGASATAAAAGSASVNAGFKDDDEDADVTSPVETFEAAPAWMEEDDMRRGGAAGEGGGAAGGGGGGAVKNRLDDPREFSEEGERNCMERDKMN